VRKNVDGLKPVCNTVSMTTNNAPEISNETINYFSENFAHEALIYTRRDLMNQIERTKTSYNYYDNQARQLASMAQAELDRIEGLRYELAAVNAAMKQKTADII